MTAYRFMIAFSALMALTAAGLQFFPGQRLTPGADLAEMPIAHAQLNFSALADRFDASGLPAPVIPDPILPPPPPPPDPAAALKRYRFIGLARSEARAAGVFERDGAGFVVAVGEEIEGFTLANLSSDGAEFLNEDQAAARLPLEAAPAP